MYIKLAVSSEKVKMSDCCPRCSDEAMPKPSFVKAVSVGRNTVTASCQLSV